MPEIKILISILNWNAAKDTINCVESLLKIKNLPNIRIKIFVIDNASADSDYEVLEKKLIKNNIKILRNDSNLGFAGGHNILIKTALADNFHYIWLLNNDTLVYEDTLATLIEIMQQDANCGSCSPVVRRLGKPDAIDFCGAIHSWQTLSIEHPKSFADASNFCSKNAKDLWLVGTALLFRVQAIKEVGLLNDKLFAYYEDNDIGMRLINAGWTNRVAFESNIEHACFDGVITDRKPYYFYLMARNSILFFLEHTPASYRKLLRAHLVDNSLAVAENLHKLGYADKANACLLGIADGLAGVGGPPALNRRVPLWLQCLRPVGRWWNRKRR